MTFTVNLGRWRSRVQISTAPSFQRPERTLFAQRGLILANRRMTHARSNPRRSDMAFVLASSYHRLLDVTVHLACLPVLGFDGNRKVGLGLEMGKGCLLGRACSLHSLRRSFRGSARTPSALAVGVLLHGINANSFLGLSKNNAFGSPKVYASVALVGFGAVSAIPLCSPLADRSHSHVL